MLEVSAMEDLLFISFPNTGGMAVSSHALSANFHILKFWIQEKGSEIYSIFNRFFYQSQSEGLFLLKILYGGEKIAI